MVGTLTVHKIQINFSSPNKKKIHILKISLSSLNQHIQLLMCAHFFEAGVFVLP